MDLPVDLIQESPAALVPLPMLLLDFEVQCLCFLHALWHVHTNLLLSKSLEPVVPDLHSSLRSNKSNAAVSRRVS